MILQKVPYVIRLCRERSKQGHLSSVRQLLEILLLMLTRGVGYDIYHYAGMWEKTASWDYKTSFLSYRDFRRAVYRVNQRKFHGVTQYKPYEKAFFNLYHIPTARYIGTLHAVSGQTRAGQPLKSVSDLESCLGEYLGAKICIKLVEGSNGRGFKAHQIVANGSAVFADPVQGGPRLSARELYDRLMQESAEGWLLEEYIEQHPTLSAFNPTSLNTVRMFVYQRLSGEVELLGAFLKTGRPGALIDKTEGGGASVHIDKDSGVLLAGFDWSPAMRPLDKHPASGEIFAGVRLPHWKKAVELACLALASSVDTRFSGVDVAFTAEGPLLVEMNVHPDPDCMPVLRLPTRKIFQT